MEKPALGEVTALLLAWRAGNEEALSKLMPLIYDHLYRIAQQKFQLYGSDGTLQPTLLVNEAYLRLVAEEDIEWQNRAHFYAIAANTIRRILIDDYRHRMASKRGAKQLTRISWAGVAASSNPPSVDLMTLNEALEKLQDLDLQQAKIIELRFFGGLNNREIGEVLGISRATVEREWRSAKAWLYTQLSGS